MSDLICPLRLIAQHAAQGEFDTDELCITFDCAWWSTAAQQCGVIPMFTTALGTVEEATVTEKQCLTCKYEDLRANEKPCNRCYVWDRWEAR